MKGLSLICLLILSFNAATQTVSTKRGLAYGYHSAADLTALSKGVSWWYNWSLKPDAAVATTYQNLGLDFVPMVWGGTPNADQIVATIPAGTKYLLGFNEPNYGYQSNITAQRAAELWPVFEDVAARKNLKLVSPAVNFCSGDCNQPDPFKYLDEFFAACPTCKVDYIAVHWYACDAPALTWYLGQLKKYGRPIWLTEFSCGDGTDRSLEVQKKYMQDALAILENDPAVFRYAWFAGRTTEIPNVNLLGASGQLTELGQLYVSLPFKTTTNGISIPGKVESEAYTQMQGIATQTTSDTGGGMNVGWIETGDWTEYSINVATTSQYDFNYRIASTANSGMIHAELDGQRITPTTSIVATGGWQSWATIKVSSVLLTQGQHRLRLVYDVGGFNINYVDIQKSFAVESNIALHKPTYSSSSQSTGNSALYATDGKSNTRWSSIFSDPQWIYIDLQSSYSIQKVVLNWEAASAKSYKIQTSNDASQWMDVYSTTTGDGGIDNIALRGVGRYVRILGTVRNTTYGYSLREIEVYGSATSSGRATDDFTEETPSLISVYPNPFQEAIHVAYFDQEKVQSIHLYTMTGTLLESYSKEHITTNEMLIGKELPIGLYLLKVATNDEVRTFQVIKN